MVTMNGDWNVDFWKNFVEIVYFQDNTSNVDQEK